MSQRNRTKERQMKRGDRVVAPKRESTGRGTRVVYKRKAEVLDTDGKVVRVEFYDGTVAQVPLDAVNPA